MSIRCVHALYNDIKNKCVLRRPNIGAGAIVDAIPTLKRSRRTAEPHDAESESGGSHGRDHPSSERIEWNAEGGQTTKYGTLRRLFAERAEVQNANNNSETFPQTRSQFSIHSPVHGTDPTINTDGTANVHAQTARPRRSGDPITQASTTVDDVFFAPPHDSSESQVCHDRLPPPYNSHGPAALPSYDLVLEEEWRRVRSLRRRTLDLHAHGTATSWHRPGLPSAFFDRQRRVPQRRREWSGLEVHE